MTAQVVVMNSIGAAVAADSAVTVGSGKTYTTADKLFQLSQEDAIGIMIYQSAHLANMPWETLIKDFRRANGAETHQTVSAYQDKFLEFVQKNAKIVPHAERVRDQERRLRAIFQEEIIDAAFASAINDGDVTPQRIANETRNAVNRFCHFVDNVAQQLPGFDVEARSTTEEQARPVASELVAKLQHDTGIENQYCEDLLNSLVRCLWLSVRSPAYTGVVIVGFGRDEYLPTCTKIEVDGFAAGQLRLSQPAISEFETTGATVIPYAQSDVVHLFMQGIDERIDSLIRESTQSYVDAVAVHACREIRAAGADVSEQLESQIRKVSSDGLSPIFGKWEDAMRDSWAPIIDSVSALPKEDLGDAAEALVDLTRFRRHASTSPETVGGPIDVAIITKADGFVWTKRKHYFPSELNPRIIARYNRRVPPSQDA